MKSETTWDFKIQEILEEIHPGRWDIQIDTSYTKIYIYFPKIIIQNSMNQSHKIVDLYLRLTFYKNTGSLSTIYGTRGKLSQAEKQSDYPHSHLSSTVTTLGAWGDFCFGGGPINNQVCSLYNNNFDALQFELFLHAFQIYIEWESIEGGPYQYIADVRRKLGITGLGNSVKEDMYKRFINKCKNLNFTVNDGKYISIDPYDPEFMDQIMPLIDNKYTVNRTTRGDFYTEGIDKTYDPIDLGFTFKGEQVFQTVFDNESEKQEGKYPHPEISEYIAKKLSRRITIYAYSQGGEVNRNPEDHLIGGIMVQDC